MDRRRRRTLDHKHTNIILAFGSGELKDNFRLLKIVRLKGKIKTMQAAEIAAVHRLCKYYAFLSFVSGLWLHIMDDYVKKFKN